MKAQSMHSFLYVQEVQWYMHAPIIGEVFNYYINRSEASLDFSMADIQNQNAYLRIELQ